MGTLEVHEEKRFAVVMYGGVSLAIYINGVAQELLQLSAATADPSAGPSEGTAGVYRQIAEKLKARFVIDILSGTSAGGINAVFLAKALANGGSMDILEGMWLDEGDIDVLINDRRSALEGLKTGFASPRSLLNSRRMYKKLLQALDAMEPTPETPPAAAAAAEAASARGGEIDLFVTATDLQGMNTPVSLSDKVVHEYRHRQVFHFQKSPDENRNDFTKADNPFLAFACRATSSFPFAFEPMRLADIDGAEPDPKWERFYRDYLLDAGQVDAKSKQDRQGARLAADGKFDVFTRRAFADGGYLDNKPFSYAVQAIASRRCDVPVDRKLLYIEPSPESIRSELEILDPPNAIENIAKVFTLARYETIREDLQAIRARNRLIERVRRILDGTLEDIHGSREKSDLLSVNNWLSRDLQQMVVREGIAYGGYLRLRVSRLTDDLAEIITRQAGFELESDLFRSVHEVVRAWRDRRYYYYKGEGDQRHNFNRFLRDFNLRFFIHRLRFTVANIDRLYRLADDKAIWVGTQAAGPEEWDLPQTVVDRIKRDGGVPEFKKRLTGIRGELSSRLEEIYKLRRRLLVPEEGSELTRAVRGMGLSARGIVATVLGPSSERGIRKAAKKVLEENTQAFSEIAALIRAIVQRADRHSDLCKVALGLGELEWPGHSELGQADLARELEKFLGGSGGPEPEITLKAEGFEVAPKAPADAAAAATWAAGYYFRRFPQYDIVAFPMLQAYDIGEELDPVEVIRVSPEDAQRLSAAGGRKLGGSAFMHFGAFLDRTWRKNDILWGRLDGAERIISSLLTGTAHEDLIPEFTAQAHSAIFEEVFLGLRGCAAPEEARRRGREMLDLLAASLLGKNPQERSAAQAKIAALVGEEKVRQILDGVILGNLNIASIEGLFKGYEVDRKLEPRGTLKSISRSVQVVGRMLGGMSQELSAEGSGKRAAAWITRMGRLLWGLVEVATPHSLPRLFFKYWLALALLTAILMALFGGLVDGGEAVRRFGLYLIFMVATVYGVWSMFQAILLSKFRLAGTAAKAVGSAIVIALLALSGVGAIHVFRAIREALAWIGGFLG